MGYTTYIHNWINYLFFGFLLIASLTNNIFLGLSMGFFFALIGDYYEWKNELYKEGRHAGIWELASMAGFFGVILIIVFVIAIINGRVRI